MPAQQTFTEAERQLFADKIAKKELDMNSEEAKLFVAKNHENSPLTFARAFLGDHFREASPTFHTNLIDIYLDHNRVAVAAPRGHAKSTVTSFAYVLHQALYKKKKSIVIISSSEDMAIRFLRRIRDELEFNPMLRWLFGDQKTDKWSETELRLSNRTVIHAKGRGAQLRGLIDGAARPDLILLDDIEDEELVRSEMRRNDLEQWFNGTVLPTLEPKIGQCIIVGTILHESSLLNRVLDPALYPDFSTHRFAAIRENGESLWPERFPSDEIDKLKKSYIARDQLAQFYMEYMNDPIPQEAAVFRPEYFIKFDELPEAKMAELFFEVYVDPGGGSARVSADPTAIVTIAVDKHNTIYVHDYINKQYKEDTQGFIDDLFLVWAKYRPQRIVIEKTVATNLLKASIEAEQLRRRIFMNIEYVTPTRGSGDRRGNMSDGKFQRIAALASPSKLGVIRYRRWMLELFEQLLAFPRAKHDDIADALAYAFMFVQRRFFSPNSSDDPVFGGRKQPAEYEPLYEELGI